MPRMITTSALVWLSLSVVASVPLVRRTRYNEAEAKFLLNLAAGAYAPTPDACLNNTLAPNEEWKVADGAYIQCDAHEGLCASYVIYSSVRKEIIVVFRGTKTKEQLILEGWQGLQPGIEFYGMGKVHKYFFRALSSLWHIVEPTLTDKSMADFTVTFTGHSLGGALASLAAARAALDGLRSGDKIKVVTFGQPRTGSAEFAINYDKMIKYSFRLVNRMDIVPHLPACHKNPHDPAFEFSHSKPCNPNDADGPYHHGTEIWYPNGMAAGAEYSECLGEPKNEDMACSDSMTFELPKYEIYINDHRHYFDLQVPNFGKFGCDLERMPVMTTISPLGAEPHPHSFRARAIAIARTLGLI